MSKYREGERRQVSVDLEGFGEFQTRWPTYEYKCPECETWHQNGGYVTQSNDDGTESLLCVPCGDKVFPGIVTDSLHPQGI